MDVLVLTVFGFYCGSLPLALWLGRYALNRDIRTVGDGNPGAFNVLRAGGLLWGGLAIMLEVAKGAFPVGLAAHVLHIDGAGLVLCALAPIVGHAWSPFLNFRGGKAIAVSLGVWIGLTIWTVPLIGVTLLVIFSALVTVSGWAIMLTMAGVGLFLILSGAPAEFLAVWVLNCVVFILRHWQDLQQPLRLRFSRG